MESELDLLLGTAVDSLTKLSVLIHLQEHPGLAQSPDRIAAAVDRPPEVVAAALAELAEGKLVERFPVGSGRVVMYGSSDDKHVQGILELLCRRYNQGGETRAQLVRRVLRLVARSEGSGRST